MPIFDRAIYLGIDLAAAEEKGRELTFKRKREEVAYRVFSAYLEIQKSRALLSAAEQAVAAGREHQRLAAVREEAGTGLKSDELRARTYTAELEQQQITARNNLTLARLRLANIIGAGPDETIDIREDLGPLPFTMDIKEVQRQAQINRQDLKELAAKVEKSEIGVQLARSAYLPTLHGMASYQMNDRGIPFGRNNDSWTVGATLRWELFDGLRRKDERGKAEANRNAMLEYQEDSRKEVIFQVEETFLRREEAGLRLDVARQSVQDVEEAVRLVSKRYENSITTFVDLMDAQTALNRTRAQLIVNESNYAQATAQTYLAAGAFLKEVLQ